MITLSSTLKLLHTGAPRSRGQMRPIPRILALEAIRIAGRCVLSCSSLSINRTVSRWVRRHAPPAAVPKMRSANSGKAAIAELQRNRWDLAAVIAPASTLVIKSSLLPQEMAPTLVISRTPAFTALKKDSSTIPRLFPMALLT
nr:hypothetical protein [Sinorhizobium fredii]